MSLAVIQSFRDRVPKRADLVAEPQRRHSAWTQQRVGRTSQLGYRNVRQDTAALGLLIGHGATAKAVPLGAKSQFHQNKSSTSLGSLCW